MFKKHQALEAIQPWIRLKTAIYERTIPTWEFKEKTGKFYKISDGLSAPAQERIRLIDERIAVILKTYSSAAEYESGFVPLSTSSSCLKSPSLGP